MGISPKMVFPFQQGWVEVGPGWVTNVLSNPPLLRVEGVLLLVLLLVLSFAPPPLKNFLPTS